EQPGQTDESGDALAGDEVKRRRRGEASRRTVDGHQAEGEQRRHRGQEDEVKVAPQLPVHLRDNAAPFPGEFRAPPPGWTSGGGPPAGDRKSTRRTPVT